MAALTGLRRDELDDLLAESDGTDGPITVSLANAALAHVLSGPTVELLDFYFRHEARFAQAGVTWTFLNNTIPFHSPRLLPAVHRIAGDRDFIGPARRRPAAPAGVRHRRPPRSARRTRPGGRVLPAGAVAPGRMGTRDPARRHRLRHRPNSRPRPRAGARRFTKECLRDQPPPGRIRVGTTIPPHYRAQEASVRCLLFPGQGVQRRGMGSGLFAQFPETTALADEILGYSIEELCTRDPDRNSGTPATPSPPYSWPTPCWAGSGSPSSLTTTGSTPGTASASTTPSRRRHARLRDGAAPGAAAR